MRVTDPLHTTRLVSRVKIEGESETTMKRGLAAYLHFAMNKIRIINEISFVTLLFKSHW